MQLLKTCGGHDRYVDRMPRIIDQIARKAKAAAGGGERSPRVPSSRTSEGNSPCSSEIQRRGCCGWTGPTILYRGSGKMTRDLYNLERRGRESNRLCRECTSWFPESS